MSRYLDMVDSPEHVKKLTLEQQKQLAEEIRHELIVKLAKNGGHLGPNLGVVEMTIALHSVFSTPKDKFVWDVSHQVYVHKLLTGRKDRFHTNEEGLRFPDGSYVYANKRFFIPWGWFSNPIGATCSTAWMNSSTPASACTRSASAPTSGNFT